MSRIRKDNFTVTDTVNGPIYGRVLSVRGSLLTVATDAGETASVLLEDTRKISANEYRNNAGKTSETFEKVDANHNATQLLSHSQGGIVKPHHVEKIESVVKPSEVCGLPVVTPVVDNRGLLQVPSVRRPGPKGTGKKSLAVPALRKLEEELGRMPSRKEAMTILMSAEIGCTKAGSSTYFYSYKKRVPTWC